MSTRSIYHKACPSCAALVAVEATQCECGYTFDAALESADFETQDVSVQERELMREYLNARIAQAVDELTSVQTMLATDPKNLQTADRLMKAYVALHQLRRELDVQPPTTDASPGATNDAPRADAGDSAASPSAPAADPAQAFRAAQARKAEQVMNAAGMSTKECTRCHAVVPLRAALCFCGHVFARSDERAASSATPFDAQRAES
jgi:hypothetical protein